MVFANVHISVLQASTSHHTREVGVHNRLILGPIQTLGPATVVADKASQ